MIIPEPAIAPANEALFPERTQSLSVRSPLLAIKPPYKALFLERTELINVKLPLL